VAAHHVSHVDFFPTLLDHLGLKASIPADAKLKLPGSSYAPMLRGESMPDWRDVVYYEMENMRCVRTPSQKLVERLGDEVDELYDLSTDPGEEHNLASASPTAALRVPLQEKLDNFFKEHASAKYDLWHGGTSQAPALVYPPKK
jgi:arylsulfatase A-like enzyme